MTTRATSAPPPPANIAAKIAAVRCRYDTARKQLRESETKELQKLQQECGVAGHRWKRNQVAGDGRDCEICDAHDPADD